MEFDKEMLEVEQDKVIQLTRIADLLEILVKNSGQADASAKHLANQPQNPKNRDSYTVPGCIR